MGVGRRRHFKRPIPSFAVNFYAMHFLFEKVPNSNHFSAGAVAGCLNAEKTLPKAACIVWISTLLALLNKRTATCLCDITKGCPKLTQSE